MLVISDSDSIYIWYYKFEYTYSIHNDESIVNPTGNGKIPCFLGHYPFNGNSVETVQLNLSIKH